MAQQRYRLFFNRWLLALGFALDVGLFSYWLTAGTVYGGSQSDRILGTPKRMGEMQAEASAKAKAAGIIGGLLNGWVVSSHVIVMGKPTGPADDQDDSQDDGAGAGSKLNPSKPSKGGSVASAPPPPDERAGPKQ